MQPNDVTRQPIDVVRSLLASLDDVREPRRLLAAELAAHVEALTVGDWTHLLADWPLLRIEALCTSLSRASAIHGIASVSLSLSVCSTTGADSVRAQDDCAHSSTSC